MTFEEFKEINKKYGLSRMWIDEFENIAKEEYEEHVKQLAEVIDDISIMLRIMRRMIFNGN